MQPKRVILYLTWNNIPFNFGDMPTPNKAANSLLKRRRKCCQSKITDSFHVMNQKWSHFWNQASALIEVTSLSGGYYGKRIMKSEGNEIATIISSGVDLNGLWAGRWSEERRSLNWSLIVSIINRKGSIRNWRMSLLTRSQNRCEIYRSTQWLLQTTLHIYEWIDPLQANFKKAGSNCCTLQAIILHRTARASDNGIVVCWLWISILNFRVMFMEGQNICAAI